MAQSISEKVKRLEGYRNRLYTTCERLIEPRPVRESNSAAGIGKVAGTPSLEGHLNEIDAQLEMLISSMSELVDRLDSAT